jgi:hypothetical protein
MGIVLASSSATALNTPTQAQIDAAYDQVVTAQAAERLALREIEKGSLVAANNDLFRSRGLLKQAAVPFAPGAGVGFDPVRFDLDYAQTDDKKATNDLASGHTEQAMADVRFGILNKGAALDVLSGLMTPNGSAASPFTVKILPPKGSTRGEVTLTNKSRTRANIKIKPFFPYSPFEFAAGRPPCAGTIKPGGSCDTSVDLKKLVKTYKPAKKVTFYSTLIFEWKAGFKKGTVEIPVEGGPGMETILEPPATAPTPPPPQPPAPPGSPVHISMNELGFPSGPTGPTPADICQGRASLGLYVLFVGIPSDTEVVMKLSGPGLPSSFSFKVNPNRPYEHSWPVPGPGTWTDEIISYGGKSPSQYEAGLKSASTSFQASLCPPA